MIMKNLSGYLFFLIPLLIGCQSTEKEQPQQETVPREDTGLILVSKEQFRTNQMEFDTLKPAIAFEGIRATGIIDVPPENRVSLSPVMGGYVTYNPLLVGDQVKKGQLLLTLENPEFVSLQQEYLEVREKLKYLKEEYDRNKELLKEQITSRKNYLRAESDYQSANAQYYGLRKRLELLNVDPDQINPENISSEFHIYAPITGSINQININKGSFAAPSTPALEIINSEHLHLELNIFEKDVMKVKKGQKLIFRVPESSTAYFPAEVHLISEALSENRTVRIHGHIPDSLKNKLVVGMYVEAVIQNEMPDGDDQKAVSASTAAVVEKDGVYYLLVLEEEKEDSYLFRQIAVDAAPESEGRRILRGTPLTPNTLILGKGAFDLVR